jgi:RimJ/RimL family protein N-acetyltransferase
LIIEKYGIKLVRVKEKDIELIRRKRNSADIRNLMQYRQTISKAMQKEWFKSINNIYNNYFIIYHGRKKIGLINGKNSDYKKKESEGGMFIWNKSYHDTVIPALCSVILSDFTFLINGFERCYIQVLKTNAKAIQHNKALGYEPVGRQPLDAETERFVLTKKNYLKKITRIRKGIQIITGDASELLPEEISFKDDSAEDIALLYKPLPPNVRKVVEKILYLHPATHQHQIKAWKAR